MNFGFENGKFYIELRSKSRPVKDLYSESLIRAEEISVNSNIVVSNSGGLDSQIMLHAFRKQGIDFQSAFLYLPGYNDNELEQVKFCDSKYGINTDIISIDPLAIKDRIDQLSLSLDIPNKHAILQRLFVEQLPNDATVIQNLGPMSIYINPISSNAYCFTGLYSLEVSHLRAIEGNYILWDYTPEYLLSTLSDDAFKAGITSYRYIDGYTGNKNSTAVDRWDYFIKPFIYGKYWKDLEYFPKHRVFENVKYIKDNIEHKLRQQSLVIPYQEFVDFLNTENTVKRFYENHSDKYELPEIK
jgi:hypothetical protein